MGLVEEYREKLGINGQDILEIYDRIAGRMKELCGQPLEEVENEIIGYAALLEDEILRQYGGKREISYEMGSVVISEVGRKVMKSSFNTLVDMFWIWKEEQRIGFYRKDLEYFIQRNSE